MANVRKGCVDVPHGEVHFRYGGTGPAVVLLHDSPRSSVIHVPNIEWLGEHFTVIALDTPGYGLSTPLTHAQPGIAEFSAALAATLDALGIERCAIYGLHTSAKIALQFAVDHPQRTVLTVLDGLSLPDRLPDDAFLSSYLRPFELTTDGSHIVREWGRVLDFHRYFPWFAVRPGARVALELPDDRRLHEYATDVFASGAHWTQAYGAALRYAASEAVPRLTSPTVFTCREDDVLYGYLDRLPDPLPHGCSVVRVPASTTAWRQRLLALLREARGHGPDWTAPSTARLQSIHAHRHRYVDLLHGQVRVSMHGSASGKPPVLLMHDLPGSVRQMDELASALGTDRLAITPEWPGLGESDPLPSATLGAFVSVLDEVLESLGLDCVDVVAEGLGTACAAALAANRPRRVRRVVLDGVARIRSRDRKRYVRDYCPPLTPDRAGSHLVRLWEQLRTAQMTWPWFERAPGAARKRPVELDAGTLHAALVDAMKQPGNYGDAARAALDAAMREIVRGIAQPVLVMHDAQDVRYNGTGTLRRRLPQGTVRERPKTLAERVATYRAFLD